MPNSLYPYKYTMPADMHTESADSENYDGFNTTFIDSDINNQPTKSPNENHNTNHDHINNIAKQPESINVPVTKTQASTDLSALMLDESQPWQVHNCKILKFQCNKSGLLPFLYYYDQLSENLKIQHPLTGKLLAQFNEKMTAKQACDVIGISHDMIISPKFVKITGSVVVYLEPLQLAVRLHWSNTSKEFDEIYCHNNSEAMKVAMEKWLFIGQVYTLYKQQKIDIAVYDEQAIKLDESEYILPSGNNYQLMPHSFSVNLLEHLHDNQQQLQWINEAIKVRVG